MYCTLCGTVIPYCTDPSGANRAYASEVVMFTRYDGDRRVETGSGMIRMRMMDEHAPTAEDGHLLRRIPARRALRFGWRAAFPSTRPVR